MAFVAIFFVMVINFYTTNISTLLPNDAGIAVLNISSCAQNKLSAIQKMAPKIYNKNN